MGYRYAVLGAGKQGVAAAYDMAKFGDADEVILADIDLAVADAGAEHINRLLRSRVVTAVQVDARNSVHVMQVLKGVKSVLSAVHYPLNPALTEAAIHMAANMCDLGGNTDIVRRQLEQGVKAEAKGVTVVPDCGMGPGMNIGLAMHAMSLVDNPREVYIWDGGLPQNPKPPWNYLLTFNVGGLTNEYYGDAYFISDGKVTKVPCFEGYEEVDIPPLGRLEAFVTSGGLSTAPWTFEGKLERLENKTLRYPGHCSQFKSFAQLGLLELKPIRIRGAEVVPRDFFHGLLEPKITERDVRDVGVIRTRCVGEKRGKPVEAVVELIDYYDEETGFTAMQRLTGWHASIVAILAAQGQIQPGAIPVELAVAGPTLVEKARQRGFDISQTVTPLP